MTPKEFKKKMEELIKIDDWEVRHCRIDGLMEFTLEELGYGEGIQLLEDVERWYA